MIYMHLNKLHNSKVNFIHSLDLLKVYTHFYKIQNKLEHKLSRIQRVVKLQGAHEMSKH